MRALELSITSWRKSSRSGDTGGACVEVAAVPSVTVVCDTRPSKLE